jgi:hypothetical protein
MRSSRLLPLYWLILAAAFIVTIAVYWPGLSGNYIFDDYPNIIDNHGVQPAHASLASLANAALSSPSSELKRPLASLSFAANYLATGLNPYWMKLTNLVIHLMNGLLVFLLAHALLRSTPVQNGFPAEGIATEVAPAFARAGMVAALITAAWMLLPINLTAVLYVVQRMESMANLFVLLGLIGYVSGRRRMLVATLTYSGKGAPGWAGFWLCAASLILPAAMGALAKETAVMLPLYALLIEWALFRFHRSSHGDLVDRRPVLHPSTALPIDRPQRAGGIDPRIVLLFLVVLALPMAAGLIWVVPGMLQPERWADRDFTLCTRLLSEARIVTDYIVWTLSPTPNALSFYHDDFNISTGLLTPWTTLVSILALAGLTALVLCLRPRRPLAALGIALFLGCQLLTGTILPLELIYEHRNYFASFGLLLAIVPLLAAPPHFSVPQGLPSIAETNSVANPASHLDKGIAAEAACTRISREALPLALPRYTLLAGLMLCWTALTALTAYTWGNPLRLAENLAARAPQSPRAQYELGRSYIIYSHYDPTSPFIKPAYASLERAAALPKSSILPEQALIFMNARMHLPLKDEWWNSLIAKLNTHRPTVQDESSLASLVQCARDHDCDLPQGRMMEAFKAALSHPDPDARLLASYSDYAWNVLNNKSLGQHMAELAVLKSPDEPAYHITLIRMLLVEGQVNKAHEALGQLQSLNFGGRLDAQLAELRALPGMQ